MEKLPQLIESRHELDVQVRFNDYDMFGHLNNNACLEYFDLAKADYFAAVLGAPVSPERFSVVVANINVNFYAPSMPGERLRVLTRMKTLGNSSLVLEQQLVGVGADGMSCALKCAAQTVMVAFDRKTLASAPIDNELRRALEAFEQ